MGSYRHMHALITAILMAAHDSTHQNEPPLDIAEFAKDAADVLRECKFIDRSESR